MAGKMFSSRITRREKKKGFKPVDGLKAFWGGEIFYKNRSLEKWEEHFKNYPKYGQRVFPKIIEKLVDKKKITVSEAENLLLMIKSEDIENQLLAVSILKQKHKKKY